MRRTTRWDKGRGFQNVGAPANTICTTHVLVVILSKAVGRDSPWQQTSTMSGAVRYLPNENIFQTKWLPASAQTHMLCMPVKIYTDSGVNNKNGCPPPHQQQQHTCMCRENNRPVIETADLLKEFIAPAPQTKKICRVQLDLESLNAWCFLFERSEFLIATCEKKNWQSVWMHG